MNYNLVQPVIEGMWNDYLIPLQINHLLRNIYIYIIIIQCYNFQRTFLIHITLQYIMLSCPCPLALISPALCTDTHYAINVYLKVSLCDTQGLFHLWIFNIAVHSTLFVSCLHNTSLSGSNACFISYSTRNWPQIANVDTHAYMTFTLTRYRINDHFFHINITTEPRCNTTNNRWYCRQCSSTWWRHQMETFFVLLAICAGNSPPAQRPVTRSFDVFFDMRPNKRLSKQSWGWWFETLQCSLWRHCYDQKLEN